MKVLMISPEITPYSKTGGLGDAVAALTKAVAERGHDVRVFTPLYGSVKRIGEWTPYPDPVRAELGFGMYADCRVWTVPFHKAQICFCEYNHFFGAPEVYSQRSDDAYRFAFFCRAAIDFCEQANWIPDIVHCHDWTTGLVPAMLNTRDNWRRIARAGTVFTIHNLQHQGLCSKNIIDYLGLPWGLFTADNYECFGGLNMMKGALYHATKITTVSPTYAYEIQTPQYGFGIDHVLRHRSRDLVGIINGIDYQEWSPLIDKYVPAHFNADDFSGKDVCKAELQRSCGLPVRGDVPVFGVVSRLYDQKGLDLFAGILPDLLSRAEMQVVLLGSGDPGLESAFGRLAAMYPSKMYAKIGYDNGLSHLIEAGSDFFVMPSRFEPCGLNQMYSMTYGTLPIVRTTGGLVDTVSAWTPDAPEGSTGINFRDADQNALRWAIERALQLYFDYPSDFYAVRRNGMCKDFSWARSVEKYEQVYLEAIETRKGAFPPPPKIVAPEPVPAKAEAPVKKAPAVPAPEPAPAKTPAAKKAETPPAPAVVPAAVPAPKKSAPAAEAPKKPAAAPAAKKAAPAEPAKKPVAPAAPKKTSSRRK